MKIKSDPFPFCDALRSFVSYVLLRLFIIRMSYATGGAVSRLSSQSLSYPPFVAAPPLHHYHCITHSPRTSSPVLSLVRGHGGASAAG